MQCSLRGSNPASQTSDTTAAQSIFSLRLPIIPVPIRVAPLDEGREGGLFLLEEAADLFGEGMIALQGQRGDGLARPGIRRAG